MGFPAAQTRQDHSQHAGHRCHLPIPRSAGQDGDYIRCAVAGP
jgi:hypothetical protein